MVPGAHTDLSQKGEYINEKSINALGVCVHFKIHAKLFSFLSLILHEKFYIGMLLRRIFKMLKDVMLSLKPALGSG